MHFFLWVVLTLISMQSDPPHHVVHILLHVTRNKNSKFRVNKSLIAKVLSFYPLLKNHHTSVDKKWKIFPSQKILAKRQTWLLRQISNKEIKKDTYKHTQARTHTRTRGHRKLRLRDSRERIWFSWHIYYMFENEAAVSPSSWHIRGVRDVQIYV